MRIGIDIRPLQSHHRVRGIGMHINALVRWIMTEYKGDDTFVFYIYKELPNPLEQYTNSGTSYETVHLSDYRNSFPFLPIIMTASIAHVRRVLTPLPSDLAKRSDVLLSFDFMLGMPNPRDVKHALIGYDLIPIMYQREYLPNFFEARKRLGTKQSLLQAFVSATYKHTSKQLKKRGTRIISISDSAKEQFVRFADIPGDRIRTVYLGNPIDNKSFVANEDDLLRVKQYKKDSYILFIGGTDWRRRINDLVAAYNLLRARGHNLKLLLAGFDFQSIDTINDLSSRDAIASSSYKDDIKLLGYVNDSEKQYLYKNALCFVYPSLCEGFGLPILEAVQEECPVIAYDGPYSSMQETAQGGAIIINPSHKAIYDSIVSLMNMSLEEKGLFIKRGQEAVEQYSWDKCAKETISNLCDDSWFTS